MTDAPRADAPLHVLLADDEPLARERLAELLEAADGVTVVAACADGEDALAAIRRHRPDLAFLDIEMPERDGVGVVEALAPEERPAVVFVTAYDRYALRAFDLHALDYLLKPFDDARFAEALDRARARVQAGDAAQLSARLLRLLRPDDVDDEDPEAPAGSEALAASASEEQPLEKIVARTGKRWHLIPAEEIDWVEGAGVYARIVTADGAHLVRTPLAELERRLDPARFARIHRSAIVQLDRIREVRPHAHGEYVLFLGDGTRLKASRTYSDRVRAYLSTLG